MTYCQTHKHTHTHTHNSLYTLTCLHLARSLERWGHKQVLGDWQSSYRRCRKDEVALCHARIGHTYLTHSYILKKDPPPQCEHWLEREILPLEVGCRTFSVVARSRLSHIFRCRTGEREMFYLKTHSTHFIYGYMASDMVKDHSDSEKGNPLPPHRLLLSINSKGSFICTIPQTG